MISLRVFCATNKYTLFFILTWKLGMYRCMIFFSLFQHNLPNPTNWLEETKWTEVVMADRLLKSFQGFMDHFKNHMDEWKSFYDSANPMEEELPERFRKLE